MPSPTKTRPIKPAKEGQSSKNPNARKRQSSARISAACEACKKRKTKCTGGPPPCQLCESLGTECVIDLSLDMRRRAALQRTMDESKSYQDTLSRLIECIREAPSSRLESLVDYTRSGASNQEIIDAVHHLHGSLGDDNSDNASLLHNNVSESPPSEPVDGSSGFRSQSNEIVSPNGEGKRVGEQALTDGDSPSTPGKGKDDGQGARFLALLSRLKTISLAEGEQLLRQFVREYASYAIATERSDSKSMLDAFGQNAVAPTSAERALWHPALHLQSQTSLTEEVRQAQSGPFQRRFSDAISMTKQGNSMSPFPYMRIASSTSLSGGQSLETNSPYSRGPNAPASPYIDFARNSNPMSPEANAWDLNVAQENQSTRLRIPVHLILPLVIPDDSFLSNVYTNYLEGARHMLETGVPVTEVVGADDEVCMDLSFRNRGENDSFDCASWACEVSRAMVDVDEFVRLASAYMLTLMMRWVLVPTHESYLRVPDMMKPTPSQRMIPHIGAIELLPLGPVRDALIYHMRDWLSLLKESGWTVNWPLDLDAAVERNPLTGSARLTTKFIQHIREYNNWSVGRDFLVAFPELSGRIRVHG